LDDLASAPALTAAEQRLRARLWRDYRMTLEEYRARLKVQGGRCAICLGKSARNLIPDHNHRCCPKTPTCGRCTRGLLCVLCNQWLLGRICKENRKGLAHALAVLRRALHYLENDGIRQGASQDG
jgi:hypothetical protein